MGDFCFCVILCFKFICGNVRNFGDERSVFVKEVFLLIWENVYLVKFCEKEFFRDILINNFYYLRKLRYVWWDLLVELVLMDLKFINFIIYDDIRFNERVIICNKNV